MNRMLSKVGVAAAAAEAKLTSALIYIPCLDVGITRKPGKHGFLYYSPGGRRIVGRSEVARLDALAIPPAYTDVVISTNPLSHLQAIGTDARGRKQYRYHPDWQSERDRAKFDRLVDFAGGLPDLRQRVDRDLRSRGLTMEKALATVVWMLDNLYIRIGNAAYAEANRSYGLTTLKSRHVQVEGSAVKFRFKGKSGKEWNLVHYDRRIANVVRCLQELPGQQLFKYICDENDCRQISSQDVNAYIQETVGTDFSSRQFRTWGATCMAVAILAPLDVEASGRAIARQINDAADAVASRLVNTRSVCKSSYIHPAVFEDFRAGVLGDVLKFRTRSERLSQWMDLEEIRVHRWLKNRTTDRVLPHS
ncbi:DNA topoisomerase IB [Rhizobium sp. ZPR3]|uniref:DNA topoisomerase n=2 Tax=unclassified Rhizobium TaxID=2613769 RepID=A0AAU7SPT0_9HYPH